MRILPLVISTLFTTLLFSQTTIEVSVLSGNITTTCTDIFSGPDPMWQVNVDNQGWEVYPRQGNCFNDLPNRQYQSTDTYDCPRDVPDEIEVCVRAFENDGLFGCAVAEACMEEYCEILKIIPAEGKRTYKIDVPSGGASEGTVEVEIDVTGTFTNSGNDHICGAFNLGTLEYNMTLGDASQGGFDNICALADDVDPRDFDPNAWSLHQGVWFTFETGEDPSSAIFVNQVNDPNGRRNSIGLQAAVFTTDNNECDGNLDLVAWDWEFDSNNDTVFFYCPEPNQKYFILVDGIWLNNFISGYFGLDILDPGVKDRGDFICDNVALGAVPADGEIETDIMSNFCVSNIGDPPISAFSSEKSVWLSFEAPATGHIMIEAMTERNPDMIDLEIAVFESLDGTCSGILNERSSATDPTRRNVEMELSCLTPGETYFLLVDGSLDDAEGLFKIKISDLPDDTPLTAQIEIICSTENLPVGNSIYTQSGNYVDTIQLGGGCDSVVFTNLTVLDPIQLSIVQLDRAQDIGSFTGSANILATGGSGNFSFLWSDGQTRRTATNLEGGVEYCVTVTDIDGTCDLETCIFIEYITPILPSFTSGDVVCNGESSGSIIFSVNNGEPPYDFEWNGSGLNGNGNITNDNETININNLPAADYEITVRDIYFDTTFVVTVVQPDKVEIVVDNKMDASCFGVCDGLFDVHGEGGVGDYEFNFSTGQTFTTGAALLCAGTYPIEMKDGNDCTTQISIEIDQPVEFIAIGKEDKGVTCLGWTDGIGTISTNGRPNAFEWENGESTETVTDLAAGDYRVTVTNQDGCKDTTIVSISEPADPYLVNIGIQEPIQCNGDDNGKLVANTQGGTTMTYKWSTGDISKEIIDLPTGNYSVTVTSETNCEAIDFIEFEEPAELTVEPTGNKLTCLDPDDGGVVQISNVGGGLAPYEYSVDGVNFTSDVSIPNLFTGVYDLIVKDDLGCEREFPFEIIPPDPIEVSLPSDMTIELGDEVVLEAIVKNDNATIEWSTPDLDCRTGDCLTVEFLPIGTQTISVTVTDSTSFCTATDKVLINVLKTYKVFIPDAFSPNNDGVNDRLGIYGANSVASIKQFKVFDRYGALMYAQNNFQPNDNAIGWDGSWKGRQLSTGVYVFFAEIEFIDGEVEIFKGDVTLVR